MKKLLINGKHEENMQAEKIAVNGDSITGYTGGKEVFSLRGVKFDKNTFTIQNEAGEEAEADLTSDDELAVAVESAQTLAELKAALLGQIRNGRAKGRPV